MKPNLTKLYGDVVDGPGGYKMPARMADEIENLLKDVSDECKEYGYKRVSTNPSSIDIVEGERADISFITTDSIDRDNEVILPKGVDWKNFLKNPVVTFAHKYDEYPVGRAQWVKRQETAKFDGWLAKTEYVPRPKDWPEQAIWEADKAWHMVKEGFLPGKSIGFIPTEMRAPEEKEIIARPELAKVSRIISKSSALEYALAPVQSNPDGLVVAVAKGFDCPPSWLEEMGLLIPMPMKSFDDLEMEKAFGEKSWTFADIKDLEDVAYGKPYPGEHSARLVPPGKFVRFRRDNKRPGKGISSIFGITKDEDVELQALRFDKTKFTPTEARAWLKEHKVTVILFESAIEEAPKAKSASEQKADAVNEIKKLNIKELVQDVLDGMRGRV